MLGVLLKLAMMQDEGGEAHPIYRTEDKSP